MNATEIKTPRKITAPENRSGFQETVSPKISREALVSWLFLIGSLMFLVDSCLENLRGISFSSMLHLTASVLFTVGSFLFIPSGKQRT